MRPTSSPRIKSKHSLTGLNPEVNNKKGYKMTFNTLYALARKNKVMIKQASEFDSMVDGLSDVQNDWKLATVEDLKEAKDYHGRISTDCESIYNNCATYRIMVKR